MLGAPGWLWLMFAGAAGAGQQDEELAFPVALTSAVGVELMFWLTLFPLVWVCGKHPMVLEASVPFTLPAIFTATTAPFPSVTDVTDWRFGAVAAAFTLQFLHFFTLGQWWREGGSGT